MKAWTHADAGTLRFPYRGPAAKGLEFLQARLINRPADERLPARLQGSNVQRRLETTSGQVDHFDRSLIVHRIAPGGSPVGQIAA